MGRHDGVETSEHRHSARLFRRATCALPPAAAGSETEERMTSARSGVRRMLLTHGV